MSSMVHIACVRENGPATGRSDTMTEKEIGLNQFEPTATSGHDAGWTALARASLGALLLAAALGVAATAGEAVRIELEWPRWAVNSVLAVIVFCLVIPGIWWLQTRVCGEPLSLIGLSGIRSSLSAGGMGFGLTVGWGLILLFACSILGWVEVGPVDISDFLVWLPGTLGFVLLYEALPEEISLRGFALTHLNRSMQLRWAVLVGLVLFGAVPIGANMIRWLLGSLFGLEEVAFSLAPEGESAVSYLSMLLGFGLA